MDQAEVAQNVRHRRGKRSFWTVMRVTIAATAASGVTAFALWLKQETPHPHAAIAMRESAWVEARSLKSPLQTAQSSALAAYGLKKDQSPPLAEASAPPAAVAAPTQIALDPPLPAQKKTVKQPPPVWLLTELPEFAVDKNARLSPAQTIDRLRQSLREAGARQMGLAVRFAVLNLSELLAMDAKRWAASLETQAANENRASAMLLTFYLQYLDRGGEGAGVKALLKAMEEGMPEERAVRECILAGRSVEELEREMGRVFAEAGVELQFTRRGGLAFRP